MLLHEEIRSVDYHSILMSHGYNWNGISQPVLTLVPRRSRSGSTRRSYQIPVLSNFVIILVRCSQTLCSSSQKGHHVSLPVHWADYAAWIPT